MFGRTKKAEVTSMQVVCTGEQPLAGNAGERHLAVHRLMPGCGRTFDFEPTWDVHTDKDGNVLEESCDARCPDCGRLTFVVKAA